MMDEYRTSSLTTRYFSDLFTDDAELSKRSKVRKENRKSVDDQCINEYEAEEMPPPMPFIKRNDSAFDAQASERCGELVTSLYPTSSKVRAVVALQSPHTILSVSDSFVQWLGYNSQELVGRSLKVLSGPRTNIAALHAAIKNAALLNFECIEAIVYANNGCGFQVLVSCFPFVDVDGSLLGCSLEVKQLSPPADSPGGKLIRIPFPSRISPAHAARRRNLNYQTGLALHREHVAAAAAAAAAPAAAADKPADLLDELLSAVQSM